MLNNTSRTFWVTVYKSDNAFYKDGLPRAISCNHVRELDCGINTVGLIVSLPDATEVPGFIQSPPTYSPPNQGSVMIPHGTIFPSPTQFPDTTFKAVTRIKTLPDNATYYVDTAEYNTNVVACFPATHN